MTTKSPEHANVADALIGPDEYTSEALGTLGYRIIPNPETGKTRYSKNPKTGDAVYHGIEEGDEGRHVVIKTFGNLERFENERACMKSVHFPTEFAPECLVSYDNEPAAPLLVMKYVRGKTLEKFVAERQPTLEEKAELLEKIARGLNALHKAGLTHRDIHADNIIVNAKGEVRLIDFGLSGTVRERSKTVASQHGEEGLGAPYDVFCFCDLAAELLCEDAFTLPKKDKEKRHDEEWVEKRSRDLGRVDRDLQAILIAGLCRRKDRKKTMDVLADQLSGWQAARARRNQTMFLRKVTAVAAVVLLVVGLFAWRQIDAANQRAALAKHQAEIKAYDELEQQVRALPHAAHRTIQDRLARAAAAESTDRDQARKILLEAVRLNEARERAQRSKELVSSMLTIERGFWTQSDAITQRVDALTKRYDEASTLLDDGEVDEALAMLEAIPADLKRLIDDNAAAGDALKAQEDLKLELHTIAHRLVRLPEFSAISDLAKSGTAAWNRGSWKDARTDYGRALDALPGFLKQHETPAETAARESANADQVRELAEVKRQMESDLKVTRSERDDARAQIATLTSERIGAQKKLAKTEESLAAESQARTLAERQVRETSADLAKAITERDRAATRVEQLRPKAELVPALQADLTKAKEELASANSQVDFLTKALKAKQPQTVSAAVLALQRLNAQLDQLDLKDWDAADSALRRAADEYQKIADEKARMRRSRPESSSIVQAVEARRQAAQVVLNKALAKRDQADRVVFESLQRQIDQTDTAYQESLKDWLPSADAPRKLKAHSLSLTSRQNAYRDGYLRATGKAAAVHVLEFVKKLPPLIHKTGELWTSPLGDQFVTIKGGTYQRGAGPKDEGSDDEKPRHTVQLTNDFLVGRDEVTQALFAKVMGYNPSYFSKSGDGASKVARMNTDSFPVEQVSWFDAIEFCIKRSELEGREPHYRLTGVVRDGSNITSAKVEILGGNGYRLLTEAEWEYVARAGTTTVFPWGDSLSSSQANFNGEYPFGNASKGQYLERPVAVDDSSYRANPWGLRHTAGNVYEWVWDWGNGNEYQQFAGKTAVDPSASEATYPVIRGGCWNSFGGRCRPAYRNGHEPGYRGSSVGFRLALGRSSGGAQR